MDLYQLLGPPSGNHHDSSRLEVVTGREHVFQTRCTSSPLLLTLAMGERHEAPHCTAEESPGQRQNAPARKESTKNQDQRWDQPCHWHQSPSPFTHPDDKRPNSEPSCVRAH